MFNIPKKEEEAGRLKETGGLHSLFYRLLD
jgi:hypothetical protein